jgi:hypothetical protein
MKELTWRETFLEPATLSAPYHLKQAFEKAYVPCSHGSPLSKADLLDLFLPFAQKYHITSKHVPKRPSTSLPPRKSLPVPDDIVEDFARSRF